MENTSNLQEFHTPGRIGFYYYPDTYHYRQIDLDEWLTELRHLGATWLVLLAPTSRAIPEFFINGLLDAGIQPVLHFPFRCQVETQTLDPILSGPFGCGDSAIPTPAIGCPPIESLRLLLSTYARWGVHYVVFFDRPNCRSSWPAADWLQGDLVERFLDLFLPLGEMALEEGLIPVFPPLAPGGDFWDLSFLRAALRGMQRRAPLSMPQCLALSAEAWVGENPLDWGAGGPEKWTAARPYDSPSTVPDQRGFRIFDWYASICRQELGVTLPMFLLRCGQRITTTVHTTDDPVADDGVGDSALSSSIRHARQNLEIARLLASSPAGEDAIPDDVLAGCFWLLALEGSHSAVHDAWYSQGGVTLPAVGALKQWAAYENRSLNGGASEDSTVPSEAVVEFDSPLPEVEETVGSSQAESRHDPSVAKKASAAMPSIGHYVLLPLYAWGAANWDLALIQPLLQSSHATIGFSLNEARLARRVTVVGEAGAISSEALGMLRKSGCHVERLLEDGTLVAT